MHPQTSFPRGKVRSASVTTPMSKGLDVMNATLVSYSEIWAEPSLKMTPTSRDSHGKYGDGKDAGGKDRG
jgi:hypothetical protein